MKDYVKCCNCDFIGTVDLGGKKCPICNTEGHLAWVNKNMQEVSDDYITGKRTPEELKKLWEELGDIPINEDDDSIDEDFYIWRKGTDKLHIWHWFDEEHPLGLVKGLQLAVGK